MEKTKKMTRIRGFKIITFPQWLQDKWNLTVKQSEKVINKEEIYQSYETIKFPKRATSKSAGYDIFSTVDFELEPNQEILIPLGIKIYMLQDEFFMVAPRSGMGFKYYIRLANTLGIIDSDYYNNEKNEGHCWAKLRNEGDVKMIVFKGDAIAQGIFQKYLLADGDSFETGETRQGGLGSTTK